MIPMIKINNSLYIAELKLCFFYMEPFFLLHSVTKTLYKEIIIITYKN